MFLLHQWIKNEPVDLLIGNTYGKYIARDEDIPFVRYGFPILDRMGHQYFPTVGYKGGLYFLEKVLNGLLDRRDRDASGREVRTGVLTRRKPPSEGGFLLSPPSDSSSLNPWTPPS